MARIKGQDVIVSLVSNGSPESGFFITDVRNFELTPKFEKLEEQYLGQTSKKYDDIFHGVDFKFDLHLEKSAAMTFIKIVQDRAASRGANTASRVNIMATLHFPDGQTKIITLKECYFDEMPLSFGGRQEYGQFTLSGSCNNISGIA